MFSLFLQFEVDLYITYVISYIRNGSTKVGDQKPELTVLPDDDLMRRLTIFLESKITRVEGMHFYVGKLAVA